jgi:NADH-quinone oxidoreductase subunit N
MFPPIALEILVLCLGFILLFAESFSKGGDKRSIPQTAIFCLFWIFVGSFFVQTEPKSAAPGDFWSFYGADPSSLFFKRIALLTTIGVLAMAIDFRGVLTRFIPASQPNAGLGEFYCIPLFTCAGLMFIASAKELIFAFTALELVTISFYILVGFMRRNAQSLEAGVKYLILGALSTGFLVYGITWIFGITGETHLDRITTKLATLHDSESAALFALALVLVGLGFKVAAVPFHGWVPDVYQGAPTPVTAFLSVGSKSAGFILLMRILEPFLASPTLQPKVITILSLLAGATVVVGNLAALTQDNLKRLLAYSSIAHAGYLLIAIASVSSKPNAFGSVGATVSFYLAAYLFMTLLSFLILNLVSSQSKGDDIAHFSGLAKRNPFLATSLLVAMASLAGVPFTAGFYGKFLVFTQAVHADHFALLALGVITVGAGFYYYFRVVAAMWWNTPTETTPIEVPFLSRLVILCCVVAIFYFGIFPKTILSLLSPALTAVVPH